MEPLEEEECPSPQSSSGLMSEELLSSSETTAAEEGHTEGASSPFSEEELSLSGESAKAYASGDFPLALSALESLSALRGSSYAPLAHNLHLLEYLNKKRSLPAFLSSLESLLKGNLELEHESQETLLYNLALGKFFQRQFQGATDLLLRLLERSTHNDSCLKRAVGLLCRVYVATRQGDKLLKLLNEVGESAAGEPSSHIFKIQSFLLAKNHKGLKKDLKEKWPFSGEESSCLLTFLRANSEYLKGNPRKAHKLLTNVEGELGGNLELGSFYHNNMGVVHLLQEKPNLAAHYLNEALEKNRKLFETPPQASCPEYLLRNKKMEITYNLAVSFLHAGTYTELSFETFLKTLPMYQKKPGLWLHLGECCIQSYQQLNGVPTYSDAVASTRDLKHRSTTLTSIGPVQHQKIVLNDASGRPFTHPGVSLPVPLDPPKNKNLNLDFGLSCLRNANILYRLAVPPSSESLLASILVNSSYISLLLKDYVTAFAKATELLDFLLCASGPIKEGSTYKLLGHLYAGEALIYLDRISEATVHLGPTTLQSLDGEVEESEQGGPYAGLGFSALNFNLSVAFALRGELDKAKGVLERSRGPKSVELATKFTMMNLYIHIMKKDMKTCKEIIQENCNVVKMPLTTHAK